MVPCLWRLWKRNCLISDTVLRAISDCHSEGIDIIVRLLLSIDRRTSLNDAFNTVQMASDYMAQTSGVVVGIDLSGDPTVSF